MGKSSYLEQQFRWLVKDSGLPDPVEEHKFDSKRKWRFDFAWLQWKIAVELEGAVWTRGRHTRGSGFIADCEKYNSATVQGWKVLRYTASDIPRSIDDIREIIKGVK